MSRCDPNCSVPKGWHQANVEKPDPSTFVWLWDEAGLKVGVLRSIEGTPLWSATNGLVPSWIEGKHQADLRPSNVPTHWMELPTPEDLKSDWFCAKDSIPPPMELVLMFNMDAPALSVGCFAFRNEDGTAQWWDTGGFIPWWDSEKYDSDLDVGCAPTHWCALPAPPLN